MQYTRFVVTLTLGLWFCASPANAADLEAVIIQGQLSGELFGWSVDRIGDVNNDGYDDFAVGAPQGVGAKGKTGVVHVFFGRNGVLPETADLVVDGEVAGDEFGYAVSGVGDINKDGYDDFVVGAPGSNAGGSDAGRVYLFLGARTPDESAVKTWDGDCPLGRMGHSVAGEFDFNDDGRPDFVVGAPDHNCTGTKAGQVRIYAGSASGFAEEIHRFHGSPNWALGTSVESAGDFNNDGIDDVAAGAPQPHDSNAGRVLVWMGQALPQPDPQPLVIVGETGNDRFGWSVATAGDINRDGRDDLVVGAPGRGTNHGAVYLFHGSPSPDGVHDWRATGSESNGELGWRVDGGLDVNGDGHADFIAGEPGANTFGNRSGAARVWFGKSNPTSSGDIILEPVSPRPSFEAGDAFGFSLAFIGSFNGDGTTEIMVGAPQGDADAGPSGYVNFFYDPDGLVPVRLLGFDAVPTPQGMRLSWNLGEAGGISGLRVEASSGGGFHALHVGWLGPHTREFLDRSSEPGAEYRLSALDRTGEIVELGLTRAETVFGVRLLSGNPSRSELRLGLRHDGGPLRLGVWDALGRKVRGIDAGIQGAGEVEITWDGRDHIGRRVAPGVYFIRVEGSPEAPLKVVRIL